MKSTVDAEFEIKKIDKEIMNVKKEEFRNQLDIKEWDDKISHIEQEIMEIQQKLDKHCDSGVTDDEIIGPIDQELWENTSSSSFK